MSARNILSRLGRTARATGRGVRHPVQTARSSAPYLLGLGAVGLGAASVAAPAARDAAFAVTMGDPNADQAFTGRKLDTRFLVGHSMGGFSGRALSYTSPSNAISFSGGPKGADTAGTGAVIGAGIGGSYGMYRGMRYGKGVKGKIGGTLLGAVGGAAIGGAVAPAVPAVQTAALMRGNRNFYDESPYAPRNTTRSLVHSTGAVGDIVLGMHNSRSGY